MSKSPSKSSCKYRKRITCDKNDTIGDFKIGPIIGQGTFSKVCQGIHIPTGEKVAIKILPKNQIKEKNDKIRIEKEIFLQKKLHHQNIIQQYSVLDTDSSIYIITEYCSGGELFDYIVSKRRLQEIEACRIFQQLINGLEYIHKQKICHRDLKPENLLFDSKHNLKIADFGLSNDYIFGRLSTPCGSPCYAAPEMVTGRKYYGDTVDIWSSGIVLYSMVCGYLPFEDDNQTVLFHKIAKGLFSLPSFLSNSCKDLIKNILVTNPNKRYGFEEIKKHPWFMSVNNIGGINILFTSPGILIDYDVIPIDVDIIKEIYYNKEYKNFSILNIINDVIRDKHNKLTTAYYLILKRKLKNNEESVSNINSNSKPFIEYMKKPISKMDYWGNDYDKIIEYYCNKVKEAINKEKNMQKLVQNKEKMEIFTENEMLNLNGLSNIINGEEKSNIIIGTNYINEDLTTIVYDEEDKDLLKIKKLKVPKSNNQYNYQKDTDENCLEYKMNNYELDSDESIIKKIFDSSRNKKQFNDTIKTTENIVEEYENNTINNEDNGNIIDKIIQNIDNGIEMSERNKKDNGRNKKSSEENLKNNSVRTAKIKRIKNKIITEKKVFNKNNNNEVLVTEVSKINNNNLSNDKSNKNNKNNIINNKNNNNKKEKEKEKKRKRNAKKFCLPNNSYFYRKIASMMDKDEKLIKYVNKKKTNNKSLKEKEENKKMYYYNRINEKYRYSKMNESRRENSIENTPVKNNSVPKNKEKSSSNNCNKSNNINIKNINNYNIDIYKYKINLVNNNNNLNVHDFYKKLNNMYKYDKFLNKKGGNNKINNKTKKKKNYNYSNPNRNYMINKPLITDNNNHKMSKKSCPISLGLNNYNNKNNKNKIKIKPMLLSEMISSKKRRFINGLSQEPLKTKSYNNNKSEDKNIIKNNNKNIKKNRRNFPFNVKCSNSHSIDDKNRNILNNRNLNNNIYNNLSEINHNTYCSNGSITYIREKTPDKNISTDLINENTYINNGNIITNDNNGNNVKNYIIYANMVNMNKKGIYNNKNIIYHKKFINLNKRYNNSVETNARKHKYTLPNPYNYNYYNNTLISIVSNKNKKKIVFPQKKNLSISNNNNNNNSTSIKANNYNKKSIKNLKFIGIRNNNCFSQEKPINNFKLTRFGFPIKSKNVSNKNKSPISNIQNNNNNTNNINNSNNKSNTNNKSISNNNSNNNHKSISNNNSNTNNNNSNTNNNNSNTNNSNTNNNNSNINYNNSNNINNNSNINNSTINNKSIKNENTNNQNNDNALKLIEKINTIPTLICCKCSIDKIKEIIEKIYLDNDKNNGIVTVNKKFSSVVIKCNTLNKNNIFCFEFNVSIFNDAKNYILIKPSLLKGDRPSFFELFEKAKKELLQ